MPAVAAVDVQGHPVDEAGDRHLRLLSRPWRPESGRPGNGREGGPIGTTLSVLRRRVRRSATTSSTRSAAGGGDVDDAAAAAGAELDLARDQREQGVVAAATDAVARVEVGAALADDDLAGVDQLAAEALHAQPLGVGVPTVAGRGRALLVCHVAASALDAR